MVTKSTKCTPQVMLSAPRRSAGVPNASGTKVLFTSSTYSFEDHKKQLELRVLDVASGESQLLAKDDEISSLNWLNEDEFACLQAEKDGSTSLYVASVSKVTEKPELGKSHYVAGKINASAGNLKVFKLDDSGSEFAVVLSAEASPDGSPYNAEKAKTTRATGRLYTELYARHWDRWETKEKNALFYGKLSYNTTSKWELSKLTNALNGTGLESPMRPFGGTDNFDLCKTCIIFVAKDPDVNPALNTKCNVYVLHIKDWASGGLGKMVQVAIPGFEGAVASPVCSPNSKKAGFLAMKQNGYEADRNQIFVIQDICAEKHEVTQAFAGVKEGSEGHWDRSASSLAFSADGKSLLLTAEEYGYAKLFVLPTSLTQDVKPKTLTNTGYVSEATALPDGRIFISGSSLVDNSVFAIVDPRIVAPEGSKPDALISWSNSNSSQGSKFGLKPSQVTSIWTPASNPSVNKEVHSVVVRPSNFNPDKKYPVAYLIHGGPQGSWADSWSTRWNLAVFAEQGYIVVAPNPTGSTGYGQEFCDSIKDQWGGYPYLDIVNVFEWVGQNVSEADNDRAVALGASYGGYMMNWIQGHDLGRKFKALVCHDGIMTMAGMISQEELYFPFRDLGGTPWYNPAPNKNVKNDSALQGHRNFGARTFGDWRKWDPSEFLENWATPQLVIHSAKDYRICIADGMGAFNVLQARGVESEFLTFPDENHWVLKPENSLVWHKVVLNFINKHVGLPPFTDQDPTSDEFWGGIREKDEDGKTEMMAQGKPET